MHSYFECTIQKLFLFQDCLIEYSITNLKTMKHFEILKTLFTFLRKHTCLQLSTVSLLMQGKWLLHNWKGFSTIFWKRW